VIAGARRAVRAAHDLTLEAGSALERRLTLALKAPPVTGGRRS